MHFVLHPCWDLVSFAFVINLDGYFWHAESNCDLIYRDIKGANLLVNASGVVKLADFGMAKHVGYETF